MHLPNCLSNVPSSERKARAYHSQCQRSTFLPDPPGLHMTNDVFCCMQLGLQSRRNSFTESVPPEGSAHCLPHPPVHLPVAVHVEVCCIAHLRKVHTFKTVRAEDSMEPISKCAEQRANINMAISPSLPYIVANSHGHSPFCPTSQTHVIQMPKKHHTGAQQSRFHGVVKEDRVVRVSRVPVPGKDTSHT